MKRKLFSLLLCVTLIFSLCCCDLNGAKSYEGSMDIPEDGIVKSEVLAQIKEDNAVVTFKGKDRDYHYEWTIFGDDIKEIRDLNLAVSFKDGKSDSQISFSFNEADEFGFSPVLSIYLNSLWDVQTATVYAENNKAVCGASVTGSETSILNYAVTDNEGIFTIKADEGKTEESSKNESKSTNSSSSSGNADNTEEDPYLSKSEDSGVLQFQKGAERIYSDGTATEKDKYLTDPVPKGKPMPVEPEDATVNDKSSYTCTFSIECSTILNNFDDLNPDKIDVMPSNGVILSAKTVTFYDGESVYDVLQRVCKDNNIQMEASFTPMYNSAYVEGINNLYEFDCGNLSGWMYRVNGWYPNYGCSRYQLAQGDVVEWRYTCDLGSDIGGGYAVGD